MGTNYYFKPAAENKLVIFGEIHIGKESGGWSFSFHGYDLQGGMKNISVESGLSVDVELPTLIVKDFGMMLALINSPGCIVSEYGETISVENFVEMVMKKKAQQNHSRSYPRDDCWQDEDGHSFGNYEFC